MVKIILKISFISLFLLMLLCFQKPLKAEEKVQVNPNNSEQLIKALNKLRFHFVENKGQVNEKVKLYLKQREGSIYFTAEGIVYQFIRFKDEKNGEHLRRLKIENAEETKRAKGVVYSIRAEFVGVSPLAEIEGLEEREAKFSFFRGKEPDKWVRAAATYGKVMYRELYPKVDLILYGQGSSLKYDYRIKQGGKVEAIAVRYDGIKGMKINAKGQLEIETEGGVLIEDAPVSYQLIDGEKVTVEAKYIIDEDNTVRFKIGEYRRDIELIIDPGVDYSSFLGGYSYDYAKGIALDSSNNAYVTGHTQSSDFPTTPGAYDEIYNINSDVFITKLDSSGSSLLYSTFLGGNDSESGRGIALDSSGNAYATGDTYSYDFPTVATAFDTSLMGHNDAFITKINSSGTNLLYTIFLGGSDYDEGYGIALDSSGNAYVTGSTESSDFLTTSGAYDTYFNGNEDAFIAKINISQIISNIVVGQGPGAASWVKDFNAYDGSLLNIWQAFGGGNANGEVSVAKGDVNGDGLAEVVLGQRSTGASSYVKVFTQDGTLLWTFQAFGGSNANGMVNVAVGDADGDGIGEIIVGQGPGGQSYVRVFEYGNANPVTTWRAFGPGNTNGEVRVAAGKTAGISLGQIITAEGHGGNSYVRVWDYKLPPALYNTFQAFGAGNPSGGVDVGVGNFDDDPSGRELIVVGQGGPGQTAAAPASSYIRIFHEDGSLLTGFPVFELGCISGRVTVSAGQADSDTADEIIVGQAVAGNSYWRVFDYDGTLIIGVKAFGAGNPSGQVDVAGYKSYSLATSPLTERSKRKWE